jgi:predicted RNase H-like HicB family nuclease
MSYKVVLRKSEEGFSVSCPGLPGCWSQGETEEEAMENIRDAIREYLLAVDELVKDEKDEDVRVVEVAI